jgi:acyl transferase domain-containing protein
VDPAHRLLLECSLEALARAGYSRADLVGKRVGVFVGLCNHDWPAVQRDGGVAVGAHSLLGHATSLAANRISFALGLDGTVLLYYAIPMWAV